MIDWKVQHRAETESTNLDARTGASGDVFTADYQTAGRGRLDHKWLSPPGTNLMMSVVLSVEGLPPEQVVTLPLVAGLAVCRAVSPAVRPSLKWPNDVLVEGRKLAGILCERVDDRVIVGIGVNVAQRQFPAEIADRATSLALCCGTNASCCREVRDAILRELGIVHDLWRKEGFVALYPQVASLDCLKGRELSVVQTDDDAHPQQGICGGIRPDGTLDLSGRPVYAGEVHIRFTL